MADKSEKDQDELSEEEAAKRLDELAKRMLNTPPKPHKSKEKPVNTENGKKDDC